MLNVVNKGLMSKTVKVTVLHKYYGCDTGCCGHVVRFPNGKEEFDFVHADTEDNFKAWAQKHAQEIVTQELGEGHVADLDWKNCDVRDYYSC